MAFARSCGPPASSRIAGKILSRGDRPFPPNREHLFHRPGVSDHGRSWAQERTRPRIRSTAQIPHLDNLFITALVRAGTCRDHARSLQITPTYRKLSGSRSNSATHSRSLEVVRRRYHTSVNRQELQAMKLAGMQEEYIRLVDYYDIPNLSQPASLRPFVTGLFKPPIPPPPIPPPTGPAKLEPSAPTIEETTSISPTATSETVTQPDLEAETEAEVYRESVEIINREISQNLATVECSHESIFELYSSLPAPRVAHLPIETVRWMLGRLSVVERKDRRSMLRFLSITEDMKVAGIPLTVEEWTSKVAFLGRSSSKVTDSHVEAALHAFQEMEHESGIPADHVTLSLLFDIATKGDNLVVADMMLDEMKARGLELNRYGRVSLIYYHGIKGDGDGVRNAYRDLVRAGEIVDTVVLNCVIASLLRAGEEAAAEHVYRRMKHLHARQIKARLPPRQWRDSRNLGRSLEKAAALYTSNSAMHQNWISASAIAPDLRTFKILVSHHALQTGEIETIGSLLHEMPFYNVRLHGSIFLALYKGFATHGARSHTAWTGPALESVWASYVRALDEKAVGLYIGKWMAVWVLWAFARCTTKKRTMEIWEEVRNRWRNPDDGEMVVVNRVLREIAAL